MLKTIFPLFSFPLFTSLSLAGFYWDEKSIKVCESLSEVFYKEFQPNFLSQRGFDNATHTLLGPSQDHGSCCSELLGKGMCGESSFANEGSHTQG